MEVKSVMHNQMAEEEHISTTRLELDAIGQLLKQKREEKLLSVEDISKNLCLQRLIIESIESGKWQNLPHTVYVRGYIRKYAELLGIYDQIIPFFAEKKSIDDISTEDIEKEKTKKRSTFLNRQEIRSQNRNISEQQTVRDFTKFFLAEKSIAKNKTDSFSIVKKIPGAIYIYSLIIFLILTFFIFNTIQNDRVEMSKLENAIQVARDIDGENVKVKTPDIIDTRKLMITCHERTWVSAIIDNNEKKEFMLNPEEIVMFNAKEKFDLLIGNAGGVKLIFNGKDIGFTGESGQVKRVTLP